MFVIKQAPADGGEGEGGAGGAAAGGGGEGGAPAGGGAAPAAGGAAAGSLFAGIDGGGAPAGGGDGAGGGSGAEGGAAPPTQDEATGRWSDVPEKFWDPEKKALRLDERGVPAGLLKAHAELESRFGAVPGKPEDYKFELGQGEQLPAGVQLDEGKRQAFAAKAHEMGLTQKQYNGVVRAHLESLAVLNAERAAAARADLVKYYGSEAAADGSLRKAMHAFRTFAEPAELEAFKQQGLSEMLAARVLARIADAIKEDETPSGAQGGAVALEAEYKRLMKDRAGPYWNPTHADHENAKATVQRYHEQQAANQRGAA